MQTEPAHGAKLRVFSWSVAERRQRGSDLMFPTRTQYLPSHTYLVSFPNSLSRTWSGTIRKKSVLYCVCTSMRKNWNWKSGLFPCVTRISVPGIPIRPLPFIITQVSLIYNIPYLLRSWIPPLVTTRSHGDKSYLFYFPALCRSVPEARPLLPAFVKKDLWRKG